MTQSLENVSEIVSGNGRAGNKLENNLASILLLGRGKGPDPEEPDTFLG